MDTRPATISAKRVRVIGDLRDRRARRAFPRQIRDSAETTDRET